MSEAKRLINRAISLLLQGQNEGAENSLEQALGEVDKLLVLAKISGKQSLVPACYQEDWNKNVMLMWVCVRKNDSSIPSDVLDFMRELLFSSAPTNETLQNLRAAGLNEPAN